MFFSFPLPLLLLLVLLLLISYQGFEVYTKYLDPIVRPVPVPVVPVAVAQIQDSIATISTDNTSSAAVRGGEALSFKGKK